MIGKLIEVHEKDAYGKDEEFLLGTIWEISDMGIWHRNLPEITGYSFGKAVALEDIPSLEIIQ